MELMSLSVSVRLDPATLSDWLGRGRTQQPSNGQARRGSRLWSGWRILLDLAPLETTNPWFA